MGEGCPWTGGGDAVAPGADVQSAPSGQTDRPKSQPPPPLGSNDCPKKALRKAPSSPPTLHQPALLLL